MATDVKVIRVPERKKEVKHYTRKPTISIAVIGGLMPTITAGINGFTKWTDSNGGNPGLQSAMERVAQSLTGYNAWDKKWHPSQATGIPPLLGGIAVHYLAQKSGVNRMIARAGIPFLRI